MLDIPLGKACFCQDNVLNPCKKNFLLMGCNSTTLIGQSHIWHKAQAFAAVPSLASEPELSHAQVGLTDSLLGDGQYGQTLLVSYHFSAAS